jgi:hypothetical protein
VPHIITSVAQTFLVKREWDKAIAVDRSTTPIAKILAMVYGGRRAEAREVLSVLVTRDLPAALRSLLEGLLNFVQGDHEPLVDSIHRALDSGVGLDPEAQYHWAGALADSGDHDSALGLLERALDAGYCPAAALASDPRFDPVRGSHDFRSLARRAEEMQRRAAESFRAADGPRLLGLPHA